MMLIKIIIRLAIIGLIFLSACIEPYDPPASEDVENLLVVDASVNSKTKRAIVRLSRTQNLDDFENPQPELSAQIYLESENGSSIEIPEKEEGLYDLIGTTITVGEKYRLHITTSGGKEYMSNFIEAKQSPAIDSISWSADGDGLQISVSSHDPTGQTSYYRWEFEETWQYQTPFYSSYYYNYEDDTVLLREEQIYRCWSSSSSNNILIASTKRLIEDVVHQQAIQLVSPNSIKLFQKYSILICQYALSQEAYEYWDNLKTNTENLGSLFDAQPFQLTGNVQSLSNPNEPVLGYFSVNVPSEKRLFVQRSKLPRDYRPQTPYHFCEEDTILLGDLPPKINSNLIFEIYDEMGFLSGYSFSNIPCTDCRRNGGTNEEPDFWE